MPSNDSVQVVQLHIRRKHALLFLLLILYCSTNLHFLLLLQHITNENADSIQFKTFPCYLGHVG